MKKSLVGLIAVWLTVAFVGTAPAADKRISIGTAGTAGLIRILRANLLDELNKPYVETARAKGMAEWRPWPKP